MRLKLRHWLPALLGCLAFLAAGLSAAKAQNADDRRAIGNALDRAQELQSQGDLKGAAEETEKALKLADRAAGPNDEIVAVIANNLGFLYNRLSQYDKAEPLFQRSLKILEANHGPDDLQVAQSCLNLGASSLGLRKWEPAEELFQRCLAIREAKLGADDPSVAPVVYDLALVNRTLGRQEKAEYYYRRSLKIDEASLRADSPLLSQVQRDLGDYYELTGQWEQAETLYLRALKNHEDKLGKDSPLVANDLNELATVYDAMGQYEKEEPLLQRSLQIDEGRGKNHRDVGVALDSLASLYRNLGQFEKAEALYLRSLKIFEDKAGKDSPDVAQSLHNLAELYNAMGQPDKAEPLYQRSLTILDGAADSKAADSNQLPTTLNNLGLLYYDRKDYAKAEPLLLRSLKIYEGAFEPNVRGQAMALNNLSLLYNGMGERETAKAFLQKSLKLVESQPAPNPVPQAQSLHNLAALDEEMGQTPDALDAFERGRRAAFHLLSNVLPVLSEREQLTFLGLQEANVHLALSFGLRKRQDAMIAARSAGWLLNWKGMGQQAIAEPALLARDGRDAASAAISRELAAVRKQLAAMTLVPAAADQVAEQRERLTRLTDKEQELSKQLGRANRTASTDAWVELTAVRKALPSDGVLLEVVKLTPYGFREKDQQVQKPHYATWTIPAEGQGEVQLIDLGDADAIDDAVKAVRQALKDAQGSPGHPSTITQDGEPEAEKALLKPLQQLSKLVLEPLAEHIDGKKRWYVSPDADLWLVPWAALPLKDGRYAVEAHTISYLVSGRDLVAAPSDAKPGRPRMMADPDYDLSVDAARAAAKELHAKPDESEPGLTLRGLPPGLTLGKAPRLPGTAAEAQAIKPALEKYAGEEAWLYKRDQALEGAFKMFHGPRVLVMSTHGFFLPDQEVAPSDKAGLDEKRAALDKEGNPLQNPLLRCGLLLAGCNNRDQAKEGDEDGVLTGLEVVGTDLRGTELVVLSACETGLGDVHNGEGVAGLRQAFQLAAHSVAATLWQVPDRESAKLMGDFFGNLAHTKDKAEALRQAQLAMIRARRDKNAAAHPFFWAAYTLTGQ